MDPTLTWLHLSDLHAGERSDWDAGRVLRSLLEDLRVLRDEQELRPDLLFFTGDAAFAGGAEEFDTAGRFLEDVREACDVRRENVFLVPGNHDVDRSVIDPDDTAWLDERRKAWDAAAVHEMLRQGDADERWRRVGRINVAVAGLATLEPELDGADVRIGLVHHPLGWLGDVEIGLGRDVERSARRTS